MWDGQTDKKVPGMGTIYNSGDAPEAVSVFPPVIDANDCANGESIDAAQGCKQMTIYLPPTHSFCQSPACSFVTGPLMYSFQITQRENRKSRGSGGCAETAAFSFSRVLRQPGRLEMALKNKKKKVCLKVQPSPSSRVFFRTYLEFSKKISG